MKTLNCKYFLYAIALVALLLLPLVGCVQKQAMVLGTPSLDERSEIPVTQMDDSELKDFLDEAYADPYNRKDFWEPKMEQVLEAKIDAIRSPAIPRDHVKYFLQAYNNRLDKIRFFDQATWIWFEDIISGKKDFRDSDKEFLKAYIKSCINNKSGEARCLKLSQEIACKLDKELCKIFGDKPPFEE
jgi:hypothetical protein